MSEQKDYWEKRANNWISGRDMPIFENLTISNYVNTISDNKNVLYIGSGTGRYLCCFNCKKLYGIDFISDFIDVANKIKPDDCELFVDDLVDLKFDKNVDIAFTKTVLQHINPIQINKAIQNLSNLKIKDIILWELMEFSNLNDYTFNHNYIELFKNIGYNLVYSEKDSNNITYLLHFQLIDEL